MYSAALHLHLESSMEVTLHSYTQTNLLSLDNELSEIIAHTARVSNPTSQAAAFDSDRLIAYLIEHKHWSPFEMVSVTLDITTTRDIARQLLRHRSFSFQEFSQRYAVQDTFVMREPRMQDPKNRQSSLPCTDESINIKWKLAQEEVLRVSKKAYNFAIDNGVAKEVARAVLPEGMTESRLFMHGSIRSLIHYLSIRTGVETQKEHRLIALEIAKAIDKVFQMP